MVYRLWMMVRFLRFWTYSLAWSKLVFSSVLGRRALHQLNKVVTVNFVHDAKHPPAVVTDPLQVLPFAGVGLSCRRGDDRARCVIKEGMR